MLAINPEHFSLMKVRYKPTDDMRLLVILQEPASMSSWLPRWNRAKSCWYRLRLPSTRPLRDGMKCEFTSSRSATGGIGEMVAVMLQHPPDMAKNDDSLLSSHIDETEK